MRIGTDEAGKGDYFGYLVVAAVLVDDNTEKKLQELGVRDSKRLSDLQIRNKAVKIKRICRYEIVKISPEKYNNLYDKFSSLNRLLEWAHTRAIKNMLKRENAELVIIDKFDSANIVIENVKVIQRYRAENDMAVAAASVLARDEFLRTLRALGREIGFVLPKGCTHVEKTVKDILKKYDKGILKTVAKAHFKITKRVMKNI